MTVTESVIKKYQVEVQNILKDCKKEQNSLDIESVNMFLSALHIFAKDEGVSDQEWEYIITEMTKGISGDIRFRPTVA